METRVPVTVCQRRAGALASAIIFSASFADAQPSKRECVTLNETGQELRQSRKLLDARERFHACMVPSCPQVLRDDCATRLADVDRVMPSIKVIVKDRHGNFVQPTRLILDGKDVRFEPGHEIDLDPGEHVLEVAVEGAAPMTRRVAAREGVKAQEELVRFDDLPGSSATSDATEPSSSSQRLVAFGVGGAGIVLLGIGTYFGLAAKSTYDDASSPANCPRGPSSCNSAGIDGGRRADEQATISTVTFIGGALLVAGGIALYMTAPEKRAVHVTPTLGKTAAGVAATMSW